MPERLTPDQVRLRLERVVFLKPGESYMALLSLLEDLLPELVAEAQKRADEGSENTCPSCAGAKVDGSQRYGGGVPGRMWQGRD